MTALFLYDAAYAPSLAECKRKGAIAMSHYMTRGYASTSADPVATRAAGMGALLNWEGWATELKGATRAHGRACGHEALAAVPPGVPRDNSVAIYYSVDTDLVHLSACDEAFRGINDAHAGSGIQVRVYGEGGLIERLCQMKLVQGKQWLSMSEGFGGFQHALHSGLVALVQMHDATGNWIGSDVHNTDRNTVLAPYDLGAWWNDGSPYIRRPLPPPVPPPTTPSDDPLMKELIALYGSRAEFEKAIENIVLEKVRQSVGHAIEALKTGHPSGWYDDKSVPHVVDGKGI